MENFAMQNWFLTAQAVHDEHIEYSDLQSYKYITRKIHAFNLEEFGITPNEIIITPYIVVRPDGWMFINVGYAWNGASGPTYDDKVAKYVSLPHDAGYQLIQAGLLDEAAYRPRFDLMLQKMMQRKSPKNWKKFFNFRAHLWHVNLKMFGGAAAKRTDKLPEQEIVLIAP